MVGAGRYLQRFLIELQTAIRYENISLGAGVPRGNILIIKIQRK
jgi:hypothetical protein